MLIGLFRISAGYQYNMHRIKLLKVVNFLKNLGLLKERLNKTGFIYYYKNIYTIKSLSHLRLHCVSATSIPGM